VAPDQYAIASITGWQNHSVRDANSGALKNRLGLMITSGTEILRFRIRPVGGRADCQRVTLQQRLGRRRHRSEVVMGHPGSTGTAKLKNE
jgi:hypothetical protein